MVVWSAGSFASEASRPASETPAPGAAERLIRFSETEILSVLDRKPLDMAIHSAAARGSEVCLATSAGLLSVDPRVRPASGTPAPGAAERLIRTAKFLSREPAVSVVFDDFSNQWIAGGAKGLWRSAASADAPDMDFISASANEIQHVVSTPAGVLFSTKKDLWLLRPASETPAPGAAERLLRPDRAVLLITDTGGLFGRPAATEGEASVVGLQLLYRIDISDLARGGLEHPASASRKVTSVPLPAEFRTDILLGVCYVGRSLLVVGRRAGISVVSPQTRVFPAAIPPPALDRAHVEQGFPDGWMDFAAVSDEVYLINSSSDIYHLSVGQPLRKISRWPGLAQPYRFAVLPDRRFILYPYRGNHILLADPSSSQPPSKINLLTTSSGEILARPGLAAATFRHRSRLDRLIVVAACVVLGVMSVLAVVWSFFNGIPFLYRFHPQSAGFNERWMTCRRDQMSLLQSFWRTEKEFVRLTMSSAASEVDEETRKNHAERLRVMADSRLALQESLRRFVQNAYEEGRRIRHEVSQPRIGGPASTMWSRFLRGQTRGWERRFHNIADETQKILENIGKRN